MLESFRLVRGKYMQTLGRRSVGGRPCPLTPSGGSTAEATDPNIQAHLKQLRAEFQANNEARAHHEMVANNLHEVCGPRSPLHLDEVSLTQLQNLLQYYELLWPEFTQLRQEKEKAVTERRYLQSLLVSGIYRSVGLFKRPTEGQVASRL